MLYRFLGWLSLAMILTITAPFWLRTLNQWTFKTRDKRFFQLLKFLRRLHKPLGALLAAFALWHALLALGRLRLHTGLLAYSGFILTALLGIAYHVKKDRRILKGHRTMSLISALLLALHLIWPGAVWHLFGI